MSFPWTMEGSTGGYTPRSGRAYRSNSAAPSGPRQEYQATPLGRKHTPEVHAAPHINRKRCQATDGTNESFVSTQSTDQSTTSRKFIRSASAGNMMGCQVTSGTPQRDEKGGMTPRGRRTATPTRQGIADLLGGTSAVTSSTRRAGSVDPAFALRGRRVAAVPKDRGTYDISTNFSTRRHVQPSFVDPADQGAIRPTFQRNDEKRDTIYRPMITRKPTVPSISTAKFPMTNDKTEFTRELNKKVFKPEKRIFTRADNAILGSKSVANMAALSPTPVSADHAAGRRKVATPGAEGDKREQQPSKGLKHVAQPNRQPSSRGLRSVASAPKGSLSIVRGVSEG